MWKYLLAGLAVAVVAGVAGYMYRHATEHPIHPAVGPSPPMPAAAPAPAAPESLPEESDSNAEVEQPEPAPIESSVDAATAIRGWVVDEAGVAVADAEVRAYEPNIGATKTSSNAEGYFTIEGLSPTPYRVSAHADECNDAVLESVVPGGDPVTLTLLPRSVARGAVVDAVSSQPLPRFEVAYLGRPPGDEAHWLSMVQRGRIAWMRRADAEGAFSIEGIESGEPFAVAARAEGFEPAYVQGPALSPGETSAPLRIALSSAAQIYGRVTDTSGRALASAAIHVGETLNREPITYADADGHYSLAELVRGSYTLWASHGSYVPSSEPVTLESGKSYEVNFALRSGTAVVGHAWIGGEPMPGLEIFVSGDRNAPSRRGVTETDGSYRVDGVTGGELQIVARARDWAQSHGGGILPDAQQTVMATEDDVTVDFRFPASTSSIAGVVSVHGEAPASGELEGDLFSEGSFTHFSTVLGASGEYRAEHLLPGEAHVTVRVTDSEGHELTKLLDVSVPERSEVRLDVDIGGSSTITGRMTGYGPNDFVQVHLLKGAWTVDAADLQSLIDLESIKVGESMVGEDGGFSFERVEAGEYTLVGFVLTFEPENEDRISSIRYVSDVTNVQEDAAVRVDLSLPPSAPTP